MQFNFVSKFGSYPATTLTPNSSSIPVPLDFVCSVECGWYATWATACLPYKFAYGPQWRGNSTFVVDVDTNSLNP